MAITNRFRKGSGAYNCRSCTRPTRATGRGDNENAKLCAECYDLGGIENQISDEGSTPELEAQAESLRQLIKQKGGVL